NIGKAYEATSVMHFTMHVSGTVYAFFKKKAYEFSFFISMDSRRSAMDSAVEVAISFKGSCGDPSPMKIGLIKYCCYNFLVAKTTPGAVPPALLGQAKDSTCARSPDKAHTHTRTTEEINRIILDAKRPMEMSLRRKFTHRRRTTTTSRISNCPVLTTSHDTERERESCLPRQSFSDSSRARRGSETEALTMVSHASHAINGEKIPKRDGERRIPSLSLSPPPPLSHYIYIYTRVNFYSLSLSLNNFSTDLFGANCSFELCLLLSAYWRGAGRGEIVCDSRFSASTGTFYVLLGDAKDCRFLSGKNVESRKRNSEKLGMLMSSIIYDLSFTLRFLANEISLNKEYTVLVDYAIVSSVEKEADKGVAPGSNTSFDRRKRGEREESQRNVLYLYYEVAYSPWKKTKTLPFEDAGKTPERRRKNIKTSGLKCNLKLLRKFPT
ncbi:hypothetical protein ALC56_14448, partial [Trachymyrmex septentrionalis]